MEVPTSPQFTTVPFKSLLTGIITIVETNGELPWSEVLVVVNSVEFTVSEDSCSEGSSELTKSGP